MKYPSLLAALLIGMASSGSAWSGNYSVGVEGHQYLPISNGEGGSYTGYARELLDAFAAKAGHKFTYKPMPIARLYDEFLVQKSLDLKFPDNAYWAGDAKKGLKIAYSGGLVSVSEGLMVLPADKGKPISRVAKIAIIRGFTPYPYLDQVKAKKISVSEANTPDAALSIAPEPISALTVRWL